MATESNSSQVQCVLNPYLGLTNASGFSAFAQKVFNATEKSVKLAEGGRSIMHGEVDISGCTVMFTDAQEGAGYLNSGVAVYVENCDETYKKALTEGATSIIEPMDKEYGRMSGVKDPFGTTWWITSIPKGAGEGCTNKLNLPPNEQPVMPYLILQDAGKFSEFVKKVFNAEEARRSMQEDGKSIQHAEAVISGSTIMFADGSEKMGYQTGGISITIDNLDDLYNKAIDGGATKIMEPADYPWGRFAGFTDPCGNTWWLNNPPKEEKRAAPEGNGASADPETNEPEVEKKVKTN